MERFGFRFDKRVSIPEVPQGKAVVKCYGMPLLVSAAQPEEVVLPSGMTRSQLSEVAKYIAVEDKDGRLTQRKMMVARGQLG